MSTSSPLDYKNIMLAEETTISPHNHFPSFLEMKVIQETTHAGQNAITTTLQAIQDHLYKNLTHGNTFKQKIMKKIHDIIQTYKLEVEALVHYIILRKSLLHSQATLSESMYGMKRSRVTSSHKLQELDSQDGIRNALLLSLSTYSFKRMETFFQKIRDASVINGKWKSFKRVFRQVYPYLHMSQHGIQLLYEFRYLIGSSRYFDPSQHILGQIVRRVTQADLDAKKKKSIGRDEIAWKENKSVVSQISSSHMEVIKKSITIAIGSALMIGYIGKLRQLMQRIRMQQSTSDHSTEERDGIGYHNQVQTGNEESAQNHPESEKAKLEGFTVPPPMKPIPPESFEGVEPNKNSQACPICLSDRVNPAASSSGYVFCFKCLVMYIRDKGPHCPVVGIHCDESQVVRLFEPSNGS
ncbi:hypothetical protein CTEN210_01098 [Chaetoceros tenuissimus]|uniref:Peroxin-12 n=1 Tax=Chaetoceros tenuissimus TaxID=426638 RepID=A0AAD3CGS8_9STRA|nr:hypothetical protein CTEN210_01098 [Chaetoceros tenuissimus]